MPSDFPTNLQEVQENYEETVPDGLRETHSFDWYLNELREDPYISRNAHQRLADMFEYYGFEYDEETGIVEYEFASQDPLNDGENVFYGREVHEAIHDFVNKVKSASRGLGPEKRIKLLLGPVGSGKSDFDRQVRRYYENYTRKQDGRMFTFRWVNLCDVIDDQDPSDDTMRSAMNQDPLVLLNQEQRNQIFEGPDGLNSEIDADYFIHNKQAPDPLSEFILDKLLAYYDDNIAEVLENHVEVVRFVVNENRRDGIETFEPKDKKNQDETELTGDVNYSKIAVYGESDPRAFDYSGAFCNANRGIFSGEELLKLQREFLYDFLHATQEQTIKPKNNPRIDIDQVIVGRTNMPEYKDKTGDEKMEAFNDRTKRIDFPYILEYSKEAEIYRKMLRNSSVEEVHIEPHTLEMGALWAVLTRIEEPSGGNVSVLQKAKAYDGEESDVDVDKLREEASDEGLSGVSARFVGDEIAEAIVQQLHDDSQSLSALSVFDHLESNLELHGSIDDSNINSYERFIEVAKDEYEELAIDDVRSALAYNTDEIQEQGEKYMNHVMAWIDDARVEDDITGEMVEPNEKFMRSVEEKLNIPRDRKKDFRQEISNWVSRRARSGESYGPRDNDRLLRALERKIWEDKKNNINFSALIRDDSGEERNDWIEALTDRGYSEEGAKEVLEYAGAIVAKEEMN